MKKVLCALVLTATLSLGACATSTPTPDNPQPPGAALMNAFLAFFTQTYQEEADFIRGFANCMEADATIKDLDGTTVEGDCSEGGTTSSTFSNYSCEDGPPMVIKLETTVKYENCQPSSDLSINGSDEKIFETLDGTMYTLDDFVQNLAVDGFSFDVDINFESNMDGEGVCSGSILVNGFTCFISADCLTCPFL